MKNLLFVILCSAAALVGCTTKHSGPDTPTKQGLSDTVYITDTVYLVESNDEDFIKFIKIFHTDTIFQKQRVADVIHGFNSSDEKCMYFDTIINEFHVVPFEDYIWDSLKVVSFLRGADKLAADTSSEYRRVIIIRSDSVIIEEFGIPSSGIVTEYYFKKKDGRWFFTELADNCL